MGHVRVTLANILVVVNSAQLRVTWAPTFHVWRMDWRVVAMEPSSPIVGLMDRHGSLLSAHLRVLAKREWAWMIARSHNFAAITIAVTLLVSHLILGNDSFDLWWDVLGWAARAEVTRSARLATTMALALHDLAADVCHIRLVLARMDRLVDVHRGLDMGTLRIQPRHLNVLHLRLVNSRAFSGEELLLVIGKDSVLNVVAFGCGALTLCELLMRRAIRFVMNIASCNLNIWMSHLCFLSSIGFCNLMVLNMNHARRVRWHMLRLKHLLLEVLTMPKLVLLDWEAEPRIVIIAHGHLVVMIDMAMLAAASATWRNYNSLTPILVVLCRTMMMWLLKLIWILILLVEVGRLGQLVDIALVWTAVEHIVRYYVLLQVALAQGVCLVMMLLGQMHWIMLCVLLAILNGVCLVHDVLLELEWGGCLVDVHWGVRLLGGAVTRVLDRRLVGCALGVGIRVRILGCDGYGVEGRCRCVAQRSLSVCRVRLLLTNKRRVVRRSHFIYIVILDAL